MFIRCILHNCVNSECSNEPGLEAPAQQHGDRVVVVCERCGNEDSYSADLLDSEDLDAINGEIGENFTSVRRFVDKEG